MEINTELKTLDDMIAFCHEFLLTIEFRIEKVVISDDKWLRAEGNTFKEAISSFQSSLLSLIEKEKIGSLFKRSNAIEYKKEQEAEEQKIINSFHCSNCPHPINSPIHKRCCENCRYWSARFKDLPKHPKILKKDI